MEESKDLSLPGGRKTGRTFRLTLRLMFALSEAKKPTKVILRSGTLCHAEYVFNCIAQHMRSFGIAVHEQSSENIVVVMGSLKHTIILDSFGKPFRGKKADLVFCDDWSD